MSAFAAAARALVGDRSRGVDAVLRPSRGAPVMLRVVRSSPIEAMLDGVQRAEQATVALADLPELPARGDELLVGRDLWVIERVEADATGAVATLTLSR